MKLSLSDSDCNGPKELCFAPPKGKRSGPGDSGSPVTVEGTDGRHTLVGVLGGTKRISKNGKKWKGSYSAEVSGKSQSNVINKKRQTGKIFCF